MVRKKDVGSTTGDEGRFVSDWDEDTADRMGKPWSWSVVVCTLPLV